MRVVTHVDLMHVYVDIWNVPEITRAVTPVGDGR